MSRSPFDGRSIRIVVAALSAVALALVGTASASDKQYYLHNSQTAPNDHCYEGYGYVDLLEALPTGATTAFTGATRMACTQPIPAGALAESYDNSLELWFTNTHRKSCTTSWYLYNNGTPTHIGEVISGTYYGGPAITVPGNTATPTKFTVSFWVPTKTLVENDQLQLHVNTRTASGSCSQMTLYYGSADRASNVSLPTLVG